MACTALLCYFPELLLAAGFDESGEVGLPLSSTVARPRFEPPPLPLLFCVDEEETRDLGDVLVYVVVVVLVVVLEEGG